MSKQDTSIVGLDIGTTRTTAVIAEVNGDGRPEVMGVGAAESRGLRKGVIVNPEQAAEPIRRAVEEAERISGLIAESVHVSMSGTLLKGLNNRGIIAITSADRRITRADIKRVIETACVISLPGGHEIIDVQPQEYIIDGQDGISDPLDMLGTRLEVAVHIITGPITVRQNIVSAVNRAGLLVADVVLEPVAAADATLTDDEREYGSAVINIGGETTSLAIYQRGAVQHTAIFPFGGSHFTNDIAFGLRTPIPEAERIKRTYGCVLPSLVAETEEMIEVPSVSRRPPRSLSREILCEILQPRAEEILGHINDEIKRAGYERELSSGVILTGGGALTQGLADLAEQVFDHPTRIGYPLGVNGMSSDEINSPHYSTAIGLVMVAHRGRMGHYYRAPSQTKSISRTAARVKSWFGNFF
jgi:cell division protein FtsA